MLAIIDAYRAGLLHKQYWYQNILSGVIVGIVAIPLAMAFAIASGMKPEQGLYTAIIAALFVGCFGGSRVQIAGPTGAFIVILAHITATHGVIGLQIATLLAGFILLFMGALKLGNVIKFIPDPVIVGFTAGIGFIIFVGEWKDFFGLSISLPLNAHFYQKLITNLVAFPKLNITTTALALLSLFLVIITPRFVKYIPGPLVAMVITTSLSMIFQWHDVATIGSTFGAIKRALPTLHFPAFTMHDFTSLIQPAFTIALLGAIESLLSATAADGMANTKHDANQELIGQGLANIAAPLFGGFAATGAIARTATNIRHGGNSPLSAITHSAFLIFVLLCLAPYASYIPLCTLAAILFVVAFNMSDVSHVIYTIKHAPRDDVIVLLTTFFLTVFTDLVVAVNVGVILAMLFFIRQMIQSVDIKSFSTHELHHELTNSNMTHLPPDVMVYSIQGPFFFAAAEKIEHALAITHTDPKTIILRLHEIPFIDMTGLERFNELMHHYQNRHIQIYLCEATTKIKNKLAKLDIFSEAKHPILFNTLTDALAALALQNKSHTT